MMVSTVMKIKAINAPETVKSTIMKLSDPLRLVSNGIMVYETLPSLKLAIEDRLDVDKSFI